jgi:hypothetical protein
MSDITLDTVWELARTLASENRARLVELLRETLPPKLNNDDSREQLLTEFEHKKATGAFHKLPSLRGKYARPDIDVSAEEIQSYLHEVGTEWEKEMDEFLGDD